MQAPSEGLWHSDVRVAVLVAEHVFAAVVVGVVHVGLVAAFCDGVVGGVQSEGICCLQKAAAEEVTVAFVAFFSMCSTPLHCLFADMHAPPAAAVCSSEHEQCWCMCG